MIARLQPIHVLPRCGLHPWQLSNDPSVSPDMKRRHAGTQPDSGSAAAPTGVAAGKRTRTGSLPPPQRPAPPDASHGFYPLPPAAHDTEETPTSFADEITGEATRPTGIPVVDAGRACERDEPAADCFLSPPQRGDLTSELGNRIDKAHANYTSATSDARTDVLLTKEGGWGFVAEMLFNVISYGAVGGLMKGVTMLRDGTTIALAGAEMTNEVRRSLMESASRLPVDAIEGLLVHNSKAIRAQIKSSVGGLPPQAHHRMAFLDQLGAAADLYYQSIAEQAPASLDDAQLVALTHAFHIRHHSKAFYRDQIVDAAARFDKQAIADIGDNRTGRQQLVRFHAHGQSRLAMAQLNHTEEVFKYRGESYSSDGRRIFMGWVDEDLSEFAQELSAKRDTPILDVEVRRRGSRRPIGLGSRHDTAGFLGRYGDEAPSALTRWIDQAAGDA